MIKAYAYLGYPYLPTAWEIYRGRIKSARTNWDDNSRPISFFFERTIRKSLDARNFTRIANEIFLDTIRRKICKDRAGIGLISRMWAIYLLPNMDMAMKYKEYCNSKAYTDDTLCEVEILPEYRSSIHDLCWIPEDFDSKLYNNDEDCLWMYSYWLGEPKSDNPIWEILYEGMVKVLDQKMREKAFNIIKANQPHCLPLLERVRISAEQGHKFGSSCPHLVQINDKQLQLGFMIDFRDANNWMFGNLLKDYSGPIKDELKGVPDKIQLLDLSNFIRILPKEFDQLYKYVLLNE